jgi:predicted anti-sigma-YlaC factor YlaD
VSTHCERARQWVSAELDGRLSEFEQALLDGHMRGCAACAEFRASVTRFTDGLRAAPLERLDQPVTITRVRRRLSLRFAPAAVAALAVMAVGLGSILASSIVRPGSGVSQAPASPSDQRLSPTNGPVNVSAIAGLRRDRLMTAQNSVDTSRIQRPARGGTVLR